MARTLFYEWDGPEYAFSEKGADWYWALGIIAIAGAFAAVLFNNILLSCVILVGAASLALHAAKHPRMHRYQILNSGIAIDGHLYPYGEMLSFSVLEYADPALPPSLSVKTKHLLAPHLLIPLVGIDPVEIYDLFIQHLPEGRHDESLIEHLIDLIRA